MGLGYGLNQDTAAHQDIHLAQHDHYQREQACHLRKPLQGWALLQRCGSIGESDFAHNTEGVLVAKKDYNQAKHSDEIDVPNLQVIKALQSLTSKGFVKTQFSWQWYYYILTPEGVEFLREWCVLRSCSSSPYPNSIAGCTFLLRLSLQPTKRLPDHNDQLEFVLVEGMVLTVLPVVVTAMTTVRRREVHLVSSGPSLLVSVGVLPESKDFLLALTCSPGGCYAKFCIWHRPTIIVRACILCLFSSAIAVGCTVQLT
jgi:hypothetical protein